MIICPQLFLPAKPSPPSVGPISGPIYTYLRVGGSRSVPTGVYGALRRELRVVWEASATTKSARAPRLR